MSDTAASGSMAFAADDASAVDIGQGSTALLTPRSLKAKTSWSADAAALSPERRTLAVFGADFSGIVDASSGKRLRTFASPPAGIGSGTPFAAAFSPDGKRVALADSASSQLIVWDAETGKRVGAGSSAGSSDGSSLWWTSDSKLVVAGRQPFVAATMLPARKLLAGWSEGGHQGDALIGAGHTLIVDTLERAVEIDVATGEPTGRAWHLPGRCAEVMQCPLALDRDRGFLAYAWSDVGTIRLVRLADGASVEVGTVWIGHAQHGVVTSDGLIDAPDEALSCAATSAATKSPGLLRRFFVGAPLR